MFAQSYTSLFKNTRKCIFKVVVVAEFVIPAEEKPQRRYQKIEDELILHWLVPLHEKTFT